MNKELTSGRELVTIFPSMAHKGGAEDIAVSLAKALNSNPNPPFLTLAEEVADQYRATGCDFRKFNLKNIRRMHKEGDIFISHHRKTTTYLLILSKIFFAGKLRIIHVAHNTFSSLRRASLFPPHNVAVGNTVKENMISYFGVPDKNITVIYNGIKDHYDAGKDIKRISEGTINVLFLGRITPVKQQVRFVEETKGKLNDNIKIWFGGEGPDFEALKAAVGDDPHYECLGLINVYNRLYEFDYVALFSEKEGLPLSLIEAGMFHKPVITNDIPQSLEVNRDNYNGFVCKSWEEVAEKLNNLPDRNSNAYKDLAENSRGLFNNLFSFDVMIQNYKNFINSINWEG